jgi:hypothetical protein
MVIAVSLHKLPYMLLIVLVLAVPFSYSLTASIGNARMILKPEVPEGKIVTIDKSLLVRNVNNISVNVSLEPDERYKRIIALGEESLILSPGESGTVPFTITLKSGGNYEGKILVTFRPQMPMEKQVPVGLSSTIIIVAQGPVNDEYYAVMAPENSTEEEIPQEEADTVIPKSQGTLNPYQATKVVKNEAVPTADENVSLQDSSEEKKPFDYSKLFSANTFLLILMFFAVFLLALNLYLIREKIVKRKQK